MDNFKFFTFISPVLDSLSKGSIIRKIMAFLFGMIGVLSFVGGIYFFFKTISYAPDFWFVVLLLLFLFSSFISLQIWLYRAKEIIKLVDSDFTVIPIFSQLFRALGENYALFLATIGLGGTLMLWLSKYASYLWEFTRFIPFISIEGSFVGGIFFLLLTTIISFFILLITYFLAENILVLVEIANNTRKSKQKEEIE